ncbi:MAG: hypothetical protein KKE73_04255 [Proteobacteria bacterium]|nr:hypothetical protein [Pseudomonadota bacterium]
MKKSTKIKAGVGVAAVGASLLFNGCVTPANAGWFEAPPSKVAERALEHGKLAARMGDEAEAKAAFEKARENYAKAMESKPGWRSIALGYAEACVRTGEYAEAAKVCEGLISTNRADDVPYAFAFAGVAYAKMGETQKAAEMLDSTPSVTGKDVVAKAAKVQAVALRGGVADADMVLTSIDNAMLAQTANNSRNHDGSQGESGDSGGSGGSGAGAGAGGGGGPTI